MKVFLSYRSDDTSTFTERLHDFLGKQLHIHSVMGGESIPPGDNWREWIRSTIAGCDAFVAVIGPKWERADGKRDIDNKDDIVRVEVEQALMGTLHLIPILVDRCKLQKEALPRSLYGLADHQFVFANSPFEKHLGLAALTVKLLRIADELRPKPIVLLSSTLAFLGDGESTEGLDYFTTLVMTIVQVLRERKHEVILKVPMYAGPNATVDVAENQRAILHQIVEDLSGYSGVIIAPFRTDDLREELVQLLLQHRNFPIGTIDKAYTRDDPIFALADLAAPPGSVCDGEFNGRLAAQSVMDYLCQASVSEANVVVLQGLQGSEGRIIGFIKEVDKHNSIAPETRKIHLAISRETPFLASEAAIRAKSYMKTGSDWSKLNDPVYTKMITNPVKRQRERVDSFFCCNDEMALGVCDMLERSWAGSGVVEPTVVVGFDGIAAVRRKIRDQDAWLLNTVDVKVREQVRQLVSAFDEALRLRRRVSDLGAVRGALVGRDQAAHVEVMLDRRRTGTTSQPAASLPRLSVPLPPE